MGSFNWICPHCERAVTISDERRSSGEHDLTIQNTDGYRVFWSDFIVCPNPACGRFTLKASLHIGNQISGSQYVTKGAKLQDWTLIPAGTSRAFPTYIPEAIRQDYQEACLIKDLSPKASATLSRRCLQGILRDFWGVKAPNLAGEIELVKDKIDALTWDAIQAVRKLGNVGAHMEKDINVIVDVDPDEAAHLIGLVETLLSEWYVAREERNVRMSAVIAAAQKKP